MKSYHYLYLLSCISLALNTSCQSMMKKKGEKPFASDATPPLGYNPTYLKGIKSMNTLGNQQAMGVISRAEVKPNLVQLFMQINDPSGYYLTDGTKKDYKKIWCLVTDSIAGRKSTLSKYNLREINENEKQPHAIALVLDHSGSMGPERALIVQQAAEDFIKKKKDEDAIMIIKYDNKIGVEVPITTNKELLLSSLKKTALQGYGGFTAICDATKAGVEQLKYVEGYQRKAVIIFTDGVDNSSKISQDSVVNFAKKEKVLVCAVDFGAGIQQGYLEQIAKPTGGTYHHTYRTDEFNYIFDDIYRRLRNSYVIDYKPLQYGKHYVTVKVCLPNNQKLVMENTYENIPDVGSVALLNVNFDFSKSSLKADSKEAIDNILNIMRNMPTVKIELRGHTDNIGEPSSNMDLSKKRAEAVRKTLIENGISAERINAKGFGDTKPIANNTNNDGRAENRRTEFVITTK